MAIKPNLFGLTDSDTEFARVNRFRVVAVADGWAMSPTYKSEPAESHATLSRDGFKMFVKARVCDPRRSRYKYEAEINLWGPDGLSIHPPLAYDWKQIVAGLRTCLHCKATDVDTMRYSFAGRCCVTCLPEMQEKYEYRGWAE